MERDVELTCIRCPKGCALRVHVNPDNTATVTGNSCPKGEEYGRTEVLNPMRTVTSSVRIAGTVNGVVSVKTKGDIPKGKIFECMDALKGVRAEAPVRIGDVMVKNVAGTGIDVVATSNYE
ncbi:MAG: DUF1667 domain-containing protein [Acetatifactor sp.]|nr:DUF1667 domain-containing protein [Acetatifactor sp.]